MTDKRLVQAMKAGKRDASRIRRQRQLEKAVYAEKQKKMSDTYKDKLRDSWVSNMKIFSMIRAAVAQGNDSILIGGMSAEAASPELASVLNSVEGLHAIYYVQPVSASDDGVTDVAFVEVRWE